MRQKRNYRYEYMNKTTPLSSRLKKKKAMAFALETNLKFS